MERGYRCVTSGHIYDAEFMHRQRALLEVASAVITNQLGTHLGYAISLGKPVQLVPAEVNRSAERVEMLQPAENKTRVDDRNFRELFSPPPTTITTGQMSLVQKYWGSTPVKSPGQMHSLLVRAEQRRRRYVLTLGLPYRMMKLWHRVQAKTK